METGGVVTQIGLKVALAVVIAVAATAGVRWLQQQARRGWRATTRAVRVLETVALGQQRAVHLISVGGRTLLIASTPSQVAMLADIGPAEKQEAERAPSPASGFSAVLSHFLRSPEAPRTEAATRLRAAASKLRAEAAEVGGA